MPNRRDFHKLAAATVAGTVVPLASRAPASATTGLEVTETADEIIIDNGPVRLALSQASPARANSIHFNGHDLLDRGRGGYDQNTTRVGPGLPLPPTDNSYEIRRGDDFVDVVFRFSPTSGGPFWLERHYLVRAGEPGVHLATVFDHPAELHGFRTDQHRYVFYLNRDLFTHACVADDPIGEPWRAGAARMPTPSELAAGPVVMDATHDLGGVETAYPRRYYTKYDWAVYMKDHTIHGLYGNGVGIWCVLPNLEAFCGGPTRQDLTLHQTTSQPVLLVEPQATHYGSPPTGVEAGQDWRKTFGPYFVYFGAGDDPAAMLAEALAYDHGEFYDRVAISGWVPRRERAQVTGRVRVPGGHDLRGAVAVLSDNGVDFQRTVLGYQYWTDVHPSGTFLLDGVRPGTYRLTIYRPGVWGEYIQDDVVVEPRRPLHLRELTWEPVRNGRTGFQIGTPDRVSAEFHRGGEFRQWGTERFFPRDFPDGVVYQVGVSTERDWNYLQFQRVDPALAGTAVTAPPPVTAGPGVWLFDFGGTGSPVAEGYQRVAHNSLYTPEHGFGLDRQVAYRDRGTPTDLRRDFTVGNGYTFLVDVPNGEYDVGVTTGDHIAANITDVSVQGAPAVRLTSATGEYAVHHTVATVSDGQLRLTFSRDGRANAVEIVSRDTPRSALAELSVDGFPLTPGFSRFEANYTVELPPDVTELTLRPIAVDGAPVTIDGTPVPAGAAHTVALTRRHQAIEVVVAHPEAARPATYRVLAVREEAPWRIRFDLAEPPAAGQTATLTLALAAWSLDTARSIPPHPSNLTIHVNDTTLVWEFEPDDARGATYRSGCGGRYYRREFRFDATALRRTGNEITLRINENTPDELVNTVAYDAIRLELD